MFDWPQDYDGAWTLGGCISRNGIGLHTGKESEVWICPSNNPGFYVSFFTDAEKIIPLRIEQVVNTPLCTKLSFDSNSLSTVEHLLSALVGCGLTHVLIKVSGSEIPLLDGSALEWVKAIEEVGITRASAPARPRPVLHSPVLIHKGASVITATPSDTLNIVGIIDFPYKAIGKQIFSIELNPKNFTKEIAPARTFGFVDQIEHLKAAGLIKGGGLDNALVCDGESWINPPLRFKDEPVRHKILDLIGDLALLGLPKAQILVYRGSHALHTDLAASIFNQCF